jgi:hypothetical protein
MVERELARLREQMGNLLSSCHSLKTAGNYSAAMSQLTMIVVPTPLLHRNRNAFGVAGFLDHVETTLALERLDLLFMSWSGAVTRVQEYAVVMSCARLRVEALRSLCVAAVRELVMRCISSDAPYLL